MARYTKNDKGYYRTGVVVGYDEKGNIKRKWLSARTIGELELKVAEVKIALGKGMVFGDDARFGDYARMWFDTYKAGKSVSTRKLYQRCMTYFGQIEHAPLKDIRGIHLQAIINDNASHPTTCEQLKLTLKQIFGQAVEDGIIVRNPAASIELPRHVKQEKRALTSEEKEAIKTADFTPQERAYVMISYGCGMRPGEIFALTWKDIDFKSSVIHVRKSVSYDKELPVISYPKTNHSIRDIEMPRIVIETLKAYRSTTIAPILFDGKDGDYMRSSATKNFWKRIKKKIDTELGYISDIMPYFFRHNYCTELNYAGVSIKEAQRLMGHSSYTTTMNFYAHIDSQKENTREKLNAINF